MAQPTITRTERIEIAVRQVKQGLDLFTAARRGCLSIGEIEAAIAAEQKEDEATWRALGGLHSNTQSLS